MKIRDGMPLGCVGSREYDRGIKSPQLPFEELVADQPCVARLKLACPTEEKYAGDFPVNIEEVIREKTFLRAFLVNLAGVRLSSRGGQYQSNNTAPEFFHVHRDGRLFERIYASSRYATIHRDIIVGYLKPDPESVIEPVPSIDAHRPLVKH